LQAVTIFGFFSNNIEDRIDEFSAFSVVTFSPVVSSTRLAENEVVRSEDLTIGTRSDAVHGSRLQIHEDSTRNKPTATSFIVIHIDSFKLERGVALVTAGGVYAVFCADDFPELGSYLVAALPALNVKDLAHFCLWFCKKMYRRREDFEFGEREPGKWKIL
jgi:hypothetical protein